MSTTQITQTLFRFVSVRNPELAHKEGIDQRFVYRPLPSWASPSPFDVAVNTAMVGQQRWTVLKNAAATFKTTFDCLTSEGELEALVGTPLYELSIWLARNKSTFANTQLLERTTTADGGENVPVKLIAPLEVSVLAKVWNNLFYQVITQESFYVKEAIMQVLVAAHVAGYMDVIDSDHGFAQNQLLANAKVVLPKNIFLDSNAPNIAVSPVPPPLSIQKIADGAMQKKQAIAAATYANKRLSAIRADRAKVFYFIF